MIPLRLLPQPTDFLTLCVAEEEDSMTVFEEDDIGCLASEDDDSAGFVCAEDAGFATSEEDSAIFVSEDETGDISSALLEETVAFPVADDVAEVFEIESLKDDDVASDELRSSAESLEFSGNSELLEMPGCVSSEKFCSVETADVLSSQFHKPRAMTVPRMQSDFMCGFMLSLLFLLGHLGPFLSG